MSEIPDLYLSVAFVALCYGAAAVGAVVAVLARWLLSRIGTSSRRPLSALEATACALLPLLTLIVMGGIAVATQTTPDLISQELHHQWHVATGRLHGQPVLHGSLHAANLVLLGLASVGVARAVFAASQIHSFARALARLAPRSVEVGSMAVHLFPSSGCHCFTAGLFRSRVYVSEGLLTNLEGRAVNAMLAHEAAHTERRDAALAALLTVFYRLLPLPGGATLYAEWVAAAERDCDARAARRVGNPCDVADALVTVAALGRAAAGSLPAATPCFATFATADDVDGRVRALLALDSPSASEPSAAHGLWGAVLVAAAGIGAATTLYPYLIHLVEGFAYH